MQEKRLNTFKCRTALPSVDLLRQFGGDDAIRIRRRITALVVLLTPILACFAQQPQQPSYNGVFTSAQAERGQREYQKYCSEGCHSAELTGNERAPSLAGDSFIQRLRGKSVGELFRRIQTTMPQTKPHSLTDQQYADILAYLLDSNGLPSGKFELPPQQERLDKLFL